MMKEPIRQAFSRAAAKPAGSSGNDFLDAILRERPDLKRQMAYFPEQGIFGHVVFIGDEVFKGPKAQMFVEGFDKEHEILKALEGVGLPIPKVTCVGKESVFYGMTRMPGVGLAAVKLTEDEERAAAKELVGFIVGMARALPLQDGKFAAHGDLHAMNVRIDSITKRLSAVIDFGEVEYRKKDVYCPSVWKAMFSFNTKLKEEYELRKAEMSDTPDASPSRRPQP